jgi:predicted enzyme related to lactoylglutathione lyase
MPNRVAHFEIHADDPERAVKFYTKVFGWKITKWEGGQMEYWMVETGGREEPGGINGGIVRRPCAVVSGSGLNGYCATIVVEDFDGLMAKAIEHGAQEAMPKFALTGMAWQGYFIDTEGNTVGLHHPDVNAK